ncbi:MAG: Hsp20/alpha crystallin family protein [Opitutales bacterium]
MYRLIRFTQPGTAGLPPVLAARTSWSGLESEMDRLFTAALSDLAVPALPPAFPVDLYEDKNNLHVRAELPGVAREAIDIELEQNTLTLAAKRTLDGQETTLTRSLTLAEPVQGDKVTATYENGVLTVTLPRQEQAQSRKINVTIN